MSVLRFSGRRHSNDAERFRGGHPHHEVLAPRRRDELYAKRKRTSPGDRCGDHRQSGERERLGLNAEMACGRQLLSADLHDRLADRKAG